MDSLHQSLSLGQTRFFATEYEQVGCIKEPNTKLTFDPRYIESGLYASEYDLRRDSGVLAHLKRLPSYYEQGLSDPDLKSLKKSSWIRPTLSWSLACEAEGLTRKMGFEAASTDIGRYSNTDVFRKLGIAVIAIHGVATVCHFPAFTNVKVWFCLHVLADLAYIIMAPMVYINLKKEVQNNRENES
mmetsp:Transcript_44272/g.58749  ORF Transcript_44272/g.58749 Transcript_44272/m.58749 type:complete len:186 (+) Transcript_44272:40-597(+)